MKYDVACDRNVIIAMRDGVDLAADVYLPAENGKAISDKLPAILVRTTYSKEKAGRSIDHEFFARSGYAVVIQDVRGRYKSEGSYYHGIHETDDGFDTLEWIAAQPWSDGKVGMTGISYLAAVQCAAAISGSPHLTSILHIKAPSDYYQHGFRHGGAFLNYSVPIAFMFASTGKEAAADPVLSRSLNTAFENGPEWLSRMPLEKGQTPLKGVPGDESFLIDVMRHADYDEFWKRVPLWQPKEYVDQYADVPGLYIGGWYDIYQEDRFFPLLAGRKSRPARLMMGPWTHLDFDCVSGDADFGPEAAMSPEEFNALQLCWMDQTLKGEDTGILDEPPVKIFVMGGGDGRKSAEGRLKHGGKWRFENGWPLARTRYTQYYFQENGVLSLSEPGNENSMSTYRYDPNDPVPTIGGTSYFLKGREPDTRKWILYVPYGAQDQRESPAHFGCQTDRPLSCRDDVLVFQTLPLDGDVEVTGPVQVKLWVSSSAVDTDFTAKLIDVYPPSGDYPDGYTMNLSDSIIRARYRNGFEEAEFMKPVENYQLDLELPATSNLFARGHRIRLDISSSSYPAFDPNPNNGELYQSGDECMVAENTIHHDVRRPSHVVLPIIPTDDRI